jgi:hypothetical protein
MVGGVLTAALSTSLLGAGPALAAVWTVAPSPPTGQDAYINGIAARTDVDAWAVGSVGQQSSKVGSLPLIDHWNGTTWSQATPRAGHPGSSGRTADRLGDGDIATFAQLVNRFNHSRG